MSGIEVRAFRRGDREQLTDLVNAHAAAVMPGTGVSVNTVLSHLERQPGEFLIGPWVFERLTLVAEQRERIAAAAHLHRYADDERVGPAYRNVGGIQWLLFWPEAAEGNPYGTDATEAAGKLIAACLRRLDDWGVGGQYAEGELPVHGVYGVPEQWPHVRSLYRQAGFAHTGHTEVVYLIAVPDLPRPEDPPIPGLAAGRSVGINGTRISALRGGDVIGYIEVQVFEGQERLPRREGWADVGNLHVAAGHRRRGVATWLLRQAGEWLRLAQVERLLDYAHLEGRDAAGQDYGDYRAFLAASGFQALTRTERGWTRYRTRVPGES
ncbi:MAG TPA: GNAT family N-acetyltransferase [Streptosporangiaceae bacterium]|nr:GNAT family N-acetyltransferase [Streptosporangiaceae bacterium]